MCTQIGHTSKWLHLISHLHFASAWQCLRAILEHHKLSRAHWYIICNFKELPIFFFLPQRMFYKMQGRCQMQGHLVQNNLRKGSSQEQSSTPHQGMAGTFQAVLHCRLRFISQRTKYPLSWSKELLPSTSCQYRGVRAHLQCSCTLIFTSGCAMLKSTTQISLCDLDLDRLMKL